LKILRVGDPHVKINNLAESEKLMMFVAKQAQIHKVDRIELLGDLFHTHAVVRVEIMDFWNKWLRTLSANITTIVLVGNHDQVGDHSSRQHALMLFKNINDKLFIVDSAFDCDNVGYLPYMHDEEEFVREANLLIDRGAKYIVCHATFQGSKYENGFYAPEGFNLDRINAPLVISGHIHARQRFGKVIYPGTAKWDTLSDANEPKGLWLVTHSDDTGEILEETFIDTSNVVSPIFSLEWKEGADAPVIPNGRVTVELIGSSDWIKKQKQSLKGRCGIKSKITDSGRRENRKVGKSLSEFISGNFEPMAGVTKDQILQFLKENSFV
jgi:DNA repair exonuclease SbcCD nuclease subunit